MLKAYNFIVDEFRGRVVKKIDNLQKFANYIGLKIEKPNESPKKVEEKNEGGMEQC